MPNERGKEGVFVSLPGFTRLSCTPVPPPPTPFADRDCNRSNNTAASVAPVRPWEAKNQYEERGLPPLMPMLWGKLRISWMIGA